MLIQAISFGELLIDFVSTQRDVSVGNAPAFTKAPGGAPANVAVGLAKLGIPTAFMGQVGDDFFGHYLVGVLAENGVDTSALRLTPAAMTALAFVSVEASGERTFVFYRKPSADMLMSEADLDKELLSQARLFHFGSITLIDDPVRSATLAAAQHAREQGALISYDPNLREPLWKSQDAARQGMQIGFEYAHVVKVSEEELAFLTGTTDLAAGIRQLWRNHTRLMVVTKGGEGCVAFSKSQSWTVPGFSVKVEDTIGAGDGFVAGLLSGLLSLGADWDQQDLTPILRRANAVGALTTSKQGGIPALPTAAELEAFLEVD
jgi:fructokinase